MKYGSEEQKKFHLPKISAGKRALCQGFSEPEPAASRLAAHRRGALATTTS